MLYCKNADCGVYLGSMGADSCSLCGHVDQDAIKSAACADRDARISELERDLAELRKDAERWAHACKGNNKQVNVCSWDNDAYEFVGYAMKKEAIDAIADAEIAAMKGTP